MRRSRFNEEQVIGIGILKEHQASMEMATPAFLSTAVNSKLVNWLPWSVLKISGRP